MSEETGPRRTIELRYRTRLNAPPPRPIRLPVPGWAGESKAHGDGAPAQPWHCLPFVDGSTYALELIYPYRTECRVTRGERGIQFDGDFGEELPDHGPNEPFGAFASHHYGMASCLDLLPPAGCTLRLEPHPRFFTDVSGEVPIAVPGHLRPFWPLTFFVVFKAPPPGVTHVFRPGEPYAQLLVVPAQVRYDIAPMDEALARARGEQADRIRRYRFLLAKHLWKSDREHWFDDVYKQLERRARTGGDRAVADHLDELLARVDQAGNPGASEG